MSYSDINDDNPALTEFGLCRDYSHLRRRSSWYSGPREVQPHDGTKATVLIVHLSYNGTEVSFTELYCRKHAAPTRAQKTKGTRGYGRVYIVDDFMPTDRAMVDRQAAHVLATAKADAAEAAKTAAAWVADHMAGHKADRLIERDPGHARTGIGENATFGTMTVRLDYKDLTPGEARWLANRLLDLADKAEGN